MKIKLLTSVIVAFAFVSCTKSTFNVNVELQNAEGKMIYLQKKVNNESITIDSALMENNVVNFVVEYRNPTTHYSVQIDKERYPIQFFSENHDVKIAGDLKDRNSITKTASYAQQLINEYNDENANFSNQLSAISEKFRLAAQNNDEAAMKTLRDEIMQVRDNQDNYRNLFLTKNSNSFVAPYILYVNRYNYELNELEDFVNHFNIKENNDYSKLLDDYIAVLQRVEVGQPYLDFTQTTPEGYMLSLSELVGKSKLLLIDFWASWCGPCRKENPNVVAVYKEYHEKGFDVLGVSLDMEKDNWIKAIEDDGLVWHNISDLKYWSNEAAKSYGISSIPSNFLLDENGIIIAKDLRGEDLRIFVESHLK